MWPGLSNALSLMLGAAVTPSPAPLPGSASGVTGAGQQSPLAPGVPVPEAAPGHGTLPIDVHDALQPAGQGAGEIAFLWWLMFWISVAVFVAVIVGLILALRRAHANEHELPRDPLAAPKKGNKAVIWLGGAAARRHPDGAVRLHGAGTGHPVRPARPRRGAHRAGHRASVLVGIPVHATR